MLNLKDNKMRKLKKIKLNQFSKDELDKRKMDALKGGCGCASKCSCTCGNGSVFVPTDDAAFAYFLPDYYLPAYNY